LPEQVGLGNVGAEFPVTSIAAAGDRTGLLAMNDQKKPKIDLKARLGKKSASSPSGPSFMPSPTGISGPGGIPAPPPSVLSAPRPAAPPRPQAIKVEMSEEVVQEQKKQQKKVYVLAIAAAIIGGLMGFGIGGSTEKSTQARVALRDASELAAEISSAADTAEQLADLVKDAREKLSGGKYPESEVQKLGGLRIPFEGINLGGRNIGRFKKDVAGGLVSFAGMTEKANEAAEHLQRVLSGSRKSLEELFAQKDKPKVTWSAIVNDGPSGRWATLVTLQEPFFVKAEPKPGGKDSWPDQTKIKLGGRESSLKRYAKGDPLRGDPQFIPVDPGSQASICQNDAATRVVRIIQEVEDSLRGVKDPGGHEETGVIEAGRALVDKLKQIGGPG
jgi:hypothetical protein